MSDSLSFFRVYVTLGVRRKYLALQIAFRVVGYIAAGFIAAVLYLTVGLLLLLFYLITKTKNYLRR